MVTPRGSGQSASGQTIPTLVLGPAHFGTWTVKHTDRTQYAGVKASYFDKDQNLRSFVEERSPIGADAGLGNFFVPNRMFSSKPEAEAAAKAQMSAILRSRGNADITLAKGDPWIKDAQKLLIRGMRDGVDGSYVIELVSHTYTADQGLMTAIKAKPPDDGSSFETVYEEASELRRQQLFAVPSPGQLLGEVLRDGSVPGFAFAFN